METALIAPANYSFFGIPTVFFSFLIPIAGVALFAYIMAIRIAPLVLAAPDLRFNRLGERIVKVVRIWLLQWRQPRYKTAGIIHIMIFAGFLVLGIRSTSLVIIGISEGFVFPGLGGPLGVVYNFFKDYAATMVLVACGFAAYRRIVVKPERYAVPSKYGHDHTFEAVFVLGMISTLMISESLFEASAAVAQARQGLHAEFIAPLSLAWIFKVMLTWASIPTLQAIHVVMYYIHDLVFFSFLCFLPMGKHFHVITSLFNVFFMRIDRGNVKPVQHGVPDEKLDDLESFGVKKLEDFTWKHILDFYSCADCGRCSDNCPANAVKRPLSPRFISIKGRDLVFKNYPLYPYGAPFNKGDELIGNIYEEDEIWSCTTCGAAWWTRAWCPNPCKNP